MADAVEVQPEHLQEAEVRQLTAALQRRQQVVLARRVMDFVVIERFYMRF